jgi:hypothetical protein
MNINPCSKCGESAHTICITLSNRNEYFVRPWRMSPCHGYRSPRLGTCNICKSGPHSSEELAISDWNKSNPTPTISEGERKI